MQKAHGAGPKNFVSVSIDHACSFSAKGKTEFVLASSRRSRQVRDCLKADKHLQMIGLPPVTAIVAPDT